MGQSLQLRQPVVIGNKDIASVEPHSPTSLLLELTSDGGEKLFAATSHHIGERMVIMLDEKVNTNRYKGVVTQREFSACEARQRVRNIVILRLSSLTPYRKC